MALKDTTKHLKDLLNQITQDIEKADGGNKAASQRVRTGTVRLEKVAKTYRKESIKNEKSSKGTKRPAAKKTAAKKTVKKATHAKPTPAKGAKHSSSHSAHGHTKHASAKAKTLKAKPKSKSHSAKPRALSFKKPSAKLLTRKHH